MVVYPNAYSLKRQCKSWLFLIPETLQPGPFSMFSFKHLTISVLKHPKLDKHFCRPNILALICNKLAAYSDYSCGALENQLVEGILLGVWRCDFWWRTAQPWIWADGGHYLCQHATAFNYNRSAEADYFTGLFTYIFLAKWGSVQGSIAFKDQSWNRLTEITATWHSVQYSEIPVLIYICR